MQQSLTSASVFRGLLLASVTLCVHPVHKNKTTKDEMGVGASTINKQNQLGSKRQRMLTWLAPGGSCCVHKINEDGTRSKRPKLTWREEPEAGLDTREAPEAGLDTFCVHKKNKIGNTKNRASKLTCFPESGAEPLVTFEREAGPDTCCVRNKNESWNTKES